VVGAVVLGAIAAFGLSSGSDRPPPPPPPVTDPATHGTTPTTAPPPPATLVLTAPGPSSAPCRALSVGLAAADLDGDGCPEPWWTSEGRLHAGGRTYAVGASGDLVAVGDWDCDGSATPALVEAGTGGVFLFPEWATAEAEVHVDAAGIVPQPQAVTVVDGGDGCQSLEVAGPAGATLFPERPQ
jgi:hypothetical protein